MEEEVFFKQSQNRGNIGNSKIGGFIMIKCQVVMNAMDAFAPRYLAEDWDLKLKSVSVGELECI